MKAVLDEMSIRRLVREGIVRRMLNEAPEGDYSDVPTFDLVSLGRNFFSGGEAGQPEKPLSKGFSSGRKRGERAVDAIARVVKGVPDRDSNSGMSYVGPELGAKIKDYIDGLQYINTPFTVADPQKVIEEWDQAVANKRIPELPKVDDYGKPVSGETIKADQGEEGLLQYLIVIATGELGFKVKLSDLTRAEGDYQTRLAPVVADLVRIINEYNTDNDLVIMADKLKSVIEVDESPGLMVSRLVLAGFARGNGTWGERFEPVGYVALAALGVAAVYFTGGAALAALAPYATVSGTALAGLSVAALASTAVVGYGLTAAADSAIKKYIDSPIGDVISAANEPEKWSEYLTELSSEISGTWFPFDSVAAYKRDSLASAMVMLAGSKPDKQKILEAIEEVLP
jgi:hypothetical protein